MARQIEPGRSAKPSLAKRGAAAVVLLVAAYLVFHVVIGIVTAIAWIVAVVVAVVAVVWAVRTLF